MSQPFTFSQRTRLNLKLRARAQRLFAAPMADERFPRRPTLSPLATRCSISKLWVAFPKLTCGDALLRSIDWKSAASQKIRFGSLV